MGSENRPKFQRESDLLKVSEMYLHGKTQPEIAEIIGVSQPTISKDLKELRKRWLEKSVQKIDARKAEELAKVDQLERVYWGGWKKSNEYQSIKKKVNGKDVTVLIPVDSSHPFGAKGFLDSIQWCINKRCQILGVDAPQKIAGPEGGDIKFVVKFK